MDSLHFDQITSSFAQAHSRRGTLRLLGQAAMGSLGLALVDDAGARKRRKKGKKTGTGSGDDGNGQGGSRHQLGEICSPSTDSCAGDLRCGPPTTRHTCSSSIPDDGSSWCCVPPVGRCNECDCRGNYSCSYDDDNVPTCVPNPEG